MKINLSNLVSTECEAKISKDASSDLTPSNTENKSDTIKTWEQKVNKCWEDDCLGWDCDWPGKFRF